MARQVPTYKTGYSGDEYVPNKNSIYDDINKIAFQLIREVTTNDKLAVFDKMPINNGDTVEQMVVKLLESKAYDKTGVGALSRKQADLAVRYFKDWNRIKFETTVDVSELRKIMLSGGDYTEVADKIVSVLSQSDMYDKYLNIKGLLKFGTQAGSNGATDTAFVNLGDVPAANGKVDYASVTKKIKNTLSGMSFVSDKYNKAGILQQSKVEDDILVIMPYTLRNELDVDFLAGLFNLEKAEIDKRILTIDTDDNIVYIVDRNAILVFTRLYMMLNQQNADGAFWNYFLHIERMYALSPLFNACYFTVLTA